MTLNELTTMLNGKSPTNTGVSSMTTTDLLSTLTPEHLKYLARLVDEDTTGNQDDALYLLLMEAYHACSEEEEVQL